MILRTPQPIVFPISVLSAPTTVDRCCIKSACKLLTAIGAITGKADATDYSPAHPATKAGHNASTLTGQKRGLCDRMRWTD